MVTNVHHTHIYRPEIQNPLPSLSEHENPIGDIHVFDMIKITMICHEHTYCILSMKINTHEMPKDCGYTFLTFVSMCVVGKTLNFSNSRCCCNETTPVTGWNLHNFYPHYTGNQLCSVRETCNLYHAYAVWGCILHDLDLSKWKFYAIEGPHLKLLTRHFSLNLPLSHWWHFITAISAIGAPWLTMPLITLRDIGRRSRFYIYDYYPVSFSLAP